MEAPEATVTSWMLHGAPGGQQSRRAGRQRQRHAAPRAGGGTPCTAMLPPCHFPLLPCRPCCRCKLLKQSHYFAATLKPSTRLLVAEVTLMGWCPFRASRHANASGAQRGWLTSIVTPAKGRGRGRWEKGGALGSGDGQGAAGWHAPQPIAWQASINPNKRSWLPSPGQPLTPHGGAVGAGPEDAVVAVADRHLYQKWGFSTGAHGCPLAGGAPRTPPSAFPHQFPFSSLIPQGAAKKAVPCIAHLVRPRVGHPHKLHAVEPAVRKVGAHNRVPAGGRGGAGCCGVCASTCACGWWWLQRCGPV